VDDPTSPVALWFNYDGRTYFTLHGNAADAARHAAELAVEPSESLGAATIDGLQLPDGRTLPAAGWEAFQVAHQEAIARRREEIAHAEAHPVTRYRLSPFAEPDDRERPREFPQGPGMWFGWAPDASDETPSWVGTAETEARRG
jgi:hypothetical protein